MSTFQQAFFAYTLPVPCQSTYSREDAKNNDLRLLVEIATNSYLRMSTDPKTSNLHFTCKLKGPECLDIEAEFDDQRDCFFFKLDCRQQRHNGNCQTQGIASKYLQIYNLFKLKRHLIEQFMTDNDLLDESPSTILTRLSGSKEQYFFEKHINSQLELRRKLRKRFDNIVNIDIKKIGKPEDKEDVSPHANKMKQNKYQQVKKKAPEAAVKSLKDEFQEAGIRSPTIKQTRISVLQQRKKCIQKKSKKKSKKNRIKRPLHGKLESNLIQEQVRQSIFILGQDQSSRGEIFIDSKVEEELPELKVLNEHAEYQWSSSDSSSEEDGALPFEPIEINREDYFKSLRNSTLKKSLQKESLSQLIFPNLKEL